MTTTTATKAMTYDTAAIINAFRAAVAAGYAADRGNERGACNFDTVYIRVPGMRERQAMEIIATLQDEDIAVHNDTRSGRVLGLECFPGQGTQRTRMTEAACQKLKECGLDAYMLWRMD